jgi:hypothetical protein
VGNQNDQQRDNTPREDPPPRNEDRDDLNAAVDEHSRSQNMKEHGGPRK